MSHQEKKIPFCSYEVSLKSGVVKGFTPIKSGFTLIELLVVIAVVGVLAGAVIVIINPAAQLGRARNAERKSDLRQMANALEEYVIVNGKYPTATSWCSTNPSGDSWQGCNALGYTNNPLYALVSGGHLKKLLQDPMAGKSNPGNVQCGVTVTSVAYLYRSNATGSEYKLMSYCGPEGDQASTFPATDPFYNPGPYAMWSWAVYSAGGAGL